MVFTVQKLEASGGVKHHGQSAYHQGAAKAAANESAVVNFLATACMSMLHPI